MFKISLTIILGYFFFLFLLNWALSGDQAFGLSGLSYTNCFKTSCSFRYTSHDTPPYKSIDSVFNHTHFYANTQPSNSVTKTKYENTLLFWTGEAATKSLAFGQDKWECFWTCITCLLTLQVYLEGPSVVERHEWWGHKEHAGCRCESNILLMTSEISQPIKLSHIVVHVVELFDICFKMCPSGPPREQYPTLTQCNRPLPHGSNHGEGA